jgi:hypothetical protein
MTFLELRRRRGTSQHRGTMPTYYLYRLTRAQRSVPMYTGAAIAAQAQLVCYRQFTRAQATLADRELSVSAAHVPSSPGLEHDPQSSAGRQSSLLYL